MQTHSIPVPLTGEARFDASHMELNRLISNLLETSDAALARALRSLHNEIASHFAQEDEELRRLGSEEHACHLDEHAAVLESLSEVDAELAGGNTAVVRRFARAMRDWLPRHVQEMDLRLARQLFKQRTDGAPILVARRNAAASTIQKPYPEGISC